MHELDFWTQCAEAMALQIEGRRLIAAELADLARQVWHHATRRLHAGGHGTDRRGCLPPL